MEFNPKDPINAKVSEMIRAKSHKFGREFRLQEADVEDTEGHLTLFIVENASKLVARTASQKTVIDRALTNEICNLIHHRLAKKRDGRRNIHVDDAPTDALLRSDAILEGAPGRMDLRNAIKRLPKELRRLTILLRHLTPTEAQRKLSLTRGQLRHRMELIGKHMIECGAADPNSHFNDKSCQ
jgi:hypothetical protein